MGPNRENTPVDKTAARDFSALRLLPMANSELPSKTTVTPGDPQPHTPHPLDLHALRKVIASSTAGWARDKQPIKPTELDLLESHRGVIPHEYPPGELGGWLDQLVSPQDSGESVVFMRTDELSSRPVYHGKPPDVMGKIARVGVYNLYTAAEQTNVANILHPEASAILAQTREVLASGMFVGILPFASEAGNVGSVIRYATSRLGGNNVIAVDAGTQDEAGEEAREAASKTGALVVSQREILDAINWNELKKLGIIPEDFIPKGAKGLTMYAGLVASEAMRILEKQFVMFHDTDIVNTGPHEGSHEARSGDYAALEHLALPYAYPLDDGQIYSSMLLKTGAGRNNEPWLLLANMLAKAAKRRGNAETAKLATLLGALGWPLSGERTLSGTVETHQGKIPLARAIPFSTGMGIETHIDVTLAGIDVKDGRRHVMQVANPNPKIENGESLDDREYALIAGCANYMGEVVDHIEEVGRGIIDWTPEDIGRFNEVSGGVGHDIFVPNKNEHHENAPVVIRTDYVLPSMQQLRDLGVVDWDKVQELARR